MIGNQGGGPSMHRQAPHFWFAFSKPAPPGCSFRYEHALMTVFEGRKTAFSALNKSLD